MKARPVNSVMSNVVAWQLGEVAHAAVKEPAGDLIDRGLILAKLLRERGFRLCFVGAEFPGSHTPCDGTGDDT